MARSEGWIGFDLDGTLAYYTKWLGPAVIGAPIGPTVEYARHLIANNIEIRIVTARYQEGAIAIRAIEEWSLKHLGKVVPVTDKKDMSMVYLIDDRAITIEPNTGRFLVPMPDVINNARGHWSKSPSAPPMEHKQ